MLGRRSAEAGVQLRQQSAWASESRVAAVCDRPNEVDLHPASRYQLLRDYREDLDSAPNGFAKLGPSILFYTSGSNKGATYGGQV